MRKRLIAVAFCLSAAVLALAAQQAADYPKPKGSQSENGLPSMSAGVS